MYSVRISILLGFLSKCTSVLKPITTKEYGMQRRTSGIANSILFTVASALASPKVSRAQSLESEAYIKPLFNLPPSVVLYPDYFEGEWSTSMTFLGADFTNLFTLNQLAKDVNIPGFRKYSVVDFPDVGQNTQEITRYLKRSDGRVVEDTEYNIKSRFQGLQGSLSGGESSRRGALVNEVIFDPVRNPNRISVQYQDPKGSGRIEIFVNNRKLSTQTLVDSGKKRFYLLTHQRQSSVRRTNDPQQAASQIIGDYAIEFETLSTDSKCEKLEGTARIFSYLQPADALYFQRPDRPVAIFNYKVDMTKIV